MQPFGLMQHFGTPPETGSSWRGGHAHRLTKLSKLANNRLANFHADLFLDLNNRPEATELLARRAQGCPKLLLGAAVRRAHLFDEADDLALRGKTTAAEDARDGTSPPQSRSKECGALPITPGENAPWDYALYTAILYGHPASMPNN